MKCIVAGHEAVTAKDFAELAFGIDLELFTGSAAETDEDRRARLDVARAVLAELRESAPEAAAYAAALLRTSPMKDRRPAGQRPRRSVRRPAVRTAVAA
ncbi:hypothetical protein [Streptomyces rapamycinicus]|uniref:Uncharacterized protein n=2 Tax=Streptomyces rapamycinicus TaxID=1226757 RepID=A0A0A0NK86_STRRN|nr:hypothetical protein [Streptomyces rapamycinicus]AGP57374.1 hypothetical protein M271_29645 [Streptomyces rapamycinicus NRRL 5491]MBB4785025.1 hypothetical protein [Streptomyces rapamycinicus]RLV79499.1 hypothetical protein D3C57_113980 [Streptomyces rapamycinicus NRRL 5491]UTO65258.1 hypothetical protein LJB45_25000 [Streptomyces rapamycinicus]UTP33214.1 hypothetical protein LIV37_30130 [Streptomyces rapamycinicus NRRL 5491]